MKVFVLGTGGWGIALAMLLHQNGHEVTSWTYLQEECDLLRHSDGYRSRFGEPCGG